MKQKDLTLKQKEVLSRLNPILKEMQDNNIGLVLDTADCTLTAYNKENVADCYQAGDNDDDCCDENDEKMNWDFTYIIPIRAENFNSSLFSCWLSFEE